MQIARAYEGLAELVGDRIRGGELRDGERLPSETALAREAGVSRSTVREALRMLEEAGLVERVSPKVLVVRGHSPERAYTESTRLLTRSNVTFDHLSEALIAIEPTLARFAAIRADSYDLAELRANLQEQEAAVDEFAAWSQLDEEFHLTIAEVSGNPALIIARAPITRLLVPTTAQFLTSTRMTQAALAFHRRIYEEIETGDGDAAFRVTREHVVDFRQAWQKSGLRLDLQVGELANGAVERPAL